MSKSKQVIRVAIIEDNELLSSVWRIWRRDQDIYCSARSLAGHFKTSLHGSGNFRHGFSTDETSQRFRPIEADRAVLKWQRPAEQSPGHTLLYQLIIPGDGLMAPKGNYSLPENVTEINRPTPEKATFVSVIESDAAIPLNSLTFGDSPAKILAEWPLPNLPTVRIAAHEELMLVENRLLLSKLRNDIMSLTSRNGVIKFPDSDSSHLRIMAIGDSHDGIGRVWDISAEFARNSFAS